MLTATEIIVNRYRELHDETYKTLKKGIWPSMKKRADSSIIVFFDKVTKNGIIHFQTPSGTTPGVIWKQQVKLLDFEKLKESGITGLPLVRKAIAGNLSLYCDDPSFTYWGFKYIAYKNGYGLKKEDRRPKIRNPKLTGTVCKHLYQVLSVLPFHAPKIYKLYKKHNLI